MEEVTLAVKINRCGRQPRKCASLSRACHKKEGPWRRKKFIGSSAKRRRNSVTLSNTTRGKGPNEPVFRLATLGSSRICSRIFDQDGVPVVISKTRLAPTRKLRSRALGI